MSSDTVPLAMIICHCLAVTDRDLRAACDAGADDARSAERLCGAGSECGGCLPLVETILRIELRKRPLRPFAVDCSAGAMAVGSRA